MNNNISLKDPEGARTNATTMKTIADEIQEVFDEYESCMEQLYGEAWNGEGSIHCSERYRELSKNYESFYNTINLMHATVMGNVANYVATDATQGSSIIG